jgi:hypothetical protein
MTIRSLPAGQKLQRGSFAAVSRDGTTIEPHFTNQTIFHVIDDIGEGELALLNYQRATVKKVS